MEIIYTFNIWDDWVDVVTLKRYVIIEFCYIESSKSEMKLIEIGKER